MEKKKGARGRPRAFDTDKALERALDLFWRKGYEGTSLTDLTDALGINRPSLYAAFGNKEALFRKALARYLSGPAAYPAEAMRLPTAREAIAGFFERSLAMRAGSDAPTGCLLVQGALACSDSSEAIRQALCEQRRASEALLRERFAQAVSDGELPAATDCTALARFYTTVSQGIAVQAATGATPDQLRPVVDLALRAWPSPPASDVP